MSPSALPEPLDELPPVIMGGAGFSYQLTNDPASLPAVQIIKRAFDLGVLAIDTSPYYEPSEQIIGAALRDPQISDKYDRTSYIISTKVGRVKADEFDYSSAAVRASVRRSLDRFQTNYLDIVFCHDVEYVSLQSALEAIQTIIEMQQEGIIRRIGISGYHLQTLVLVAQLTQEKFGRPIDVVQNWAQLTILNTRLETFGLSKLSEAGVTTIYSSSPLAIGLLRDAGVPVGALGDWHPAPDALRRKAKEVASKVKASGNDLAALSVRFSMESADRLSNSDTMVGTIIGVGSMSDLEKNVAVAKEVQNQIGRNDKLTREVRQSFGEWIDYDFSPERPVPLG